MFENRKGKHVDDMAHAYNPWSQLLEWEDCKFKVRLVDPETVSQKGKEQT